MDVKQQKENRMDIEIMHGRGEYCGIKCNQVDEFLNGDERITFGVDLLDPAIELINCGEGKVIEEVVDLLEQARYMMINIKGE